MISPRPVPNRDARYMGLAWIYASFSKDPNTQVGAQIVTSDNYPLGAGYNGPPSKIDDESFSWCRPTKDNPHELSKLDVVIHAEINAIDHSDKQLLKNSVLYVTGFPCRYCMIDIVKSGISKIIYMEYPATSGSMMNDPVNRSISEQVAKLGAVEIKPFNGDLTWLINWVEKMKGLQLFS